MGYDYVCPLQEVSPAAAASAGVASDPLPSAQALDQASSSQAPSAAQDLIVVPKRRVRRTQGPNRRDWTPPGPSRLRETVQAQENEKLTKVYEDFERFRLTGKQPTRSIAATELQVVQYFPLGSSTYRPVSMPPNASDPMRRGRRQDFTDGTQNSTSRRLGSTDLFPDRYRQEPPPGEASTEARDSIAEDRKPATRDSVASQDIRVPPDPQPESRRSAANSEGSDGSDRSSASSTESSRARKSLAYRLDKDKAAWSPNASKSAASVSFAGFKNVMRSIANTFLPSGGKSEAEHVTRELSRSPGKPGDSAGRKGGSDTHQAVENTRPVSSNRRHSRKKTIAALPLELDTSVERLGILPSPPKPSSPILEEATDDGHVASDSASQKQGPIEGELHMLIL